MWYIDPATKAANLIGIYATAEAEQSETTEGIAVPFDAYFVLTTPRAAAGEPATGWCSRSG